MELRGSKEEEEGGGGRWEQLRRRSVNLNLKGGEKQSGQKHVTSNKAGEKFCNIVHTTYGMPTPLFGKPCVYIALPGIGLHTEWWLTARYKCRRDPFGDAPVTQKTLVFVGLCVMGENG